MPLPALKPLVNWCALVGLAILTASCATTTPFGAMTATNTACGVFAPIHWSRSDTRQTVEEVKEHNAAGMEVCGWTH